MKNYKLEWGEASQYGYEEYFETLEDVKAFLREHPYLVNQGWVPDRDEHWFEVRQLINVEL